MMKLLLITTKIKKIKQNKIKYGNIQYRISNYGITVQLTRCHVTLHHVKHLKNTPNIPTGRRNCNGTDSVIGMQLSLTSKK